MKVQTEAPEQSAEEAARADVYGVLSALFYGPPEPTLLAALRAAPAAPQGAAGELEAAWQALADAARTMELPDIASEYDTLFGGVGKPEVYLFGSHYLSGFLNEKPLARLRDDLDRLGISRAEAVSETEDHFACLCAVVRHLIVEENGEGAALASQCKMFEHHLAPWVDVMCDAVQQHPKARFYALAAQFARAFMAVERQAFEMLDAEGGA